MINLEMAIDLTVLFLVSLYAFKLLFVYESGYRAPHDTDVGFPFWERIKFRTLQKRSLLNQRILKRA